MASDRKITDFRLIKNPTRNTIEAQCKDTTLELSTQFEALSDFDLSRTVVQRAEKMGIKEPGIRDKTYRFYDAQGNECPNRQDPNIRSIGLVFHFDSSVL